jgi:hypothetical protein
MQKLRRFMQKLTKCMQKLRKCMQKHSRRERNLQKINKRVKFVGLGIIK